MLKTSPTTTAKGETPAIIHPRFESERIAHSETMVSGVIRRFFPRDEADVSSGIVLKPTQLQKMNRRHLYAWLLNGQCAPLLEKLGSNSQTFGEQSR